MPASALLNAFAPRAPIKPTVTMASYVPFGTVVRIGALHRPGPRRARCVSALRWGFLRLHKQMVMQFRIEITSETAISSKVIYCAIVDEISPARAKTKAAALLDLYTGRGANSARVLNPQNEVIFRL
jgi:hypothetical protein